MEVDGENVTHTVQERQYNLQVTEDTLARIYPYMISKYTPLCGVHLWVTSNIIVCNHLLKIKDTKEVREAEARSDHHLALNGGERYRMDQHEI